MLMGRNMIFRRLKIQKKFTQRVPKDQKMFTLLIKKVYMRGYKAAKSLYFYEKC
jgi:hypothetical protein